MHTPWLADFDKNVTRYGTKYVVFPYLTESPIFIMPLAFCMIERSTMVMNGDTRKDAHREEAASAA